MVCLKWLVAASVVGYCLGKTEKLFVKFIPPSMDPLRMDSFYELPRTRPVAEMEGWELVEDRMDSDGYSIFCWDNDYRVGLLFDEQGSIAGIQVAFSKNDVEKSASPYPIHRIAFQQEKRVLDTDVYAATVLFVDDSVLKSGGRILTDNSKIAPNGMYYVLRDGKYRYVPGISEDLEGTLYRKQSCKEGMGRHFFYNVSEDLDCADFESFAPIYDEWTGELVSTAYFVFGRSSFQHPGRHWFEEPNGPSFKVVVPDSPECLKNWVDTYGIVVFHIYVHSEPWTIKCP